MCGYHGRVYTVPRLSLGWDGRVGNGGGDSDGVVMV